MTDGWMKVVIIAPHDVGDDVVRFLKKCHHYREVDHGCLGRIGVDASRVDIDAVPPVDYNGYEWQLTSPVDEDEGGPHDDDAAEQDRDQEGPGRRSVP